MNINAMSHTNDPETSLIAAEQVDENDTARIKDALVVLLSERPSTADELTIRYVNAAEFRGWPLVMDWHNFKRRLSELHTRHHVIRESGERRPSKRGKSSTVWALSVPVDEARVVVKMRGAA